VPGLAGKNIIDLLMAATPVDIPAIAAALLELGFRHQCPAAFPASRPMLWGTFRRGSLHRSNNDAWIASADRSLPAAIDYRARIFGRQCRSRAAQ
jgi:hypothetical protein